MALEGIRVIDWTIMQMGPFCSSLLGDLGADVIKVEHRVTGDPARGLKRVRGGSTLLADGRNAYFETNNRNKKGLTVDLTKKEGKEILHRLVEKSDVFVQNFRLGVAERLGLDYNSLSQYNPQLVYASTSGYGLKGPDSQKPAWNMMGLARSGIMTAVSTSDEDPVEIFGGIADQLGAMSLAYGILAALVARERNGFGQEVDASLLGSMIALQGLPIGMHLLTNLGLDVPPRKQTPNPLSNHYRCLDGRWIELTILQSDRHWPDFCRALGIERLQEDPRFENMDTRAEHSPELIAILDEVFGTRTYEQWAHALQGNGDIAFTRIQDRSELASDPQVIANEYITSYDHPALGKIKMVGQTVKLSKTPGTIRLPAPEMGQHTEEILLELGYSWADIENLKDKDVI